MEPSDCVGSWNPETPSIVVGKTNFWEMSNTYGTVFQRSQDLIRSQHFSGATEFILGNIELQSVDLLSKSVAREVRCFSGTVHHDYGNQFRDYLQKHLKIDYACCLQHYPNALLGVSPLAFVYPSKR